MKLKTVLKARKITDRDALVNVLMPFEKLRHCLCRSTIARIQLNVEDLGM